MNELKKELLEIIEVINEIELKDSIKELLSKNAIFYNSPAAKMKHHAYIGGLLEHTLQTVKLSISMMKIIQEELNINKDLVIAGAILHDIGKINCYEIVEEGIEFTNIYLKQDHIVNGIKIISQKIKSEYIDELIHIVASHHNIKEWGSPIEPKTREAWIVHMAENLSSKILG
jgi:3'-5' exoribonuclease